MKSIKKKSFKNYLLKTSWMSRLRQNYLANSEGIAAIEFALVAPIMIGMYFGLAEMASAIAVDRQISHSANVAGDLATQVSQVEPTQMAEIMTATMTVMGIPADKRDQVKMEISSYSRADDGTATTKGTVIPLGKASFNGTYPSTFDASALDERILSSSSGIVVARITYNYEPLKLQYFKSDFNLSETFLLKPRKSDNVDILDSSTGSRTFSCNYTTATAGNPAVINC